MVVTSAVLTIETECLRRNRYQRREGRIPDFARGVPGPTLWRVSCVRYNLQAFSFLTGLNSCEATGDQWCLFTSYYSEKNGQSLVQFPMTTVNPGDAIRLTRMIDPTSGCEQTTPDSDFGRYLQPRRGSPGDIPGSQPGPQRHREVMCRIPPPFSCSSIVVPDPRISRV